MTKIKKILISVLLIIILAIIVSISLFFISKSRDFQFFGNIYSSVPNDEMKIALTFDDGPTENTEIIIEKIQELDITATFFLCGSDIAERPEDAKAIAEAGYQIGNHSYSHSRMVLKSYSFCQYEIEKTNELIRESGYEGEIYFRPPYGKKLFVLPYYLEKVDMTTITWSIEPETILGYDASAEDIAQYILENVESGSIILLHPMNNAENILAALDIVVPELESQGYNFCTIEELLCD